MEKPIIKIIFFARLRELMEIDDINYQLNSIDKVTVQMVIEQLMQKYSAFENYINQGNQLMIAVNQQTADVKKIVNSGDELAFFPPVTGG